MSTAAPDPDTVPPGALVPKLKTRDSISLCGRGRRWAG